MKAVFTAASSLKCSACALRQFCLPVEFDVDALQHFDALVSRRILLRKGDSLYRQGEALHSLYNLRVGMLKTEFCLPDGRTQITGFHLSGEMVGFDGLGAQHYASSATALEESEVCEIRFENLAALTQKIPFLQKHIYQVLSREIDRDHQHFLTLGSMRAEERLAGFLLNLSQRLALRGCAADEIYLSIRREDIGNYLGIKLETVSRLFSRFSSAGLIQIKQRHVKLIDIAGLQQLAGCGPACAQKPSR